MHPDTLRDKLLHPLRLAVAPALLRLAVAPALLRLAVAPALLGLAIPAFAQPVAFPAKPIHLIVAATTGGITDIAARVVGQQLGVSLGQPVVIENKPGAGGSIGAEYVVKSPPDGYTLAIFNVGEVAIHPWIYQEMPFDPLNDLVPVAPVVDGASVLAVNASLPPHTLKELIEYAKGSPRPLNYGSAGIGTMPQLAAEVFAHMTGIELVHVPYKGANPAAIDLAAGRIQLAFIALGSMRAQIAAGQVRPLAVAARERLTAMPDIPTFEQAGLPGYDVTNWFGIFAPRGTPKEIIAILNEHIGQTLDNPEVLKRFREAGTVPMRESPETFAKRVQSDYAKWRDIIRTAGIKAR